MESFKLIYLLVFSTIVSLSRQEEITAMDWSVNTTAQLSDIEKLAASVSTSWSLADWITLNKYLEVSFYVNIVIGGLAIASNTAILVAIGRIKVTSVPHVYMLGLAVCDMTIGICVAFRALSDKFIVQSYVVHKLSHYIYWPLVGVDTGASIGAALIAMALSLDRYIALKFPLQYARICSQVRATFISVSGIIFGLVCGINIPLRNKIKMISNQNHAASLHDVTELGQSVVFRTIFAHVEFYLRFGIPLVVMAFSNTATLIIIARRKHFKRSLGITPKIVMSPKCLVTTIGLVVIFFFTQIPRAAYLLDSMIFGFNNRFTLELAIFSLAGQILAKINSVVNFFVYFFLWSGFKNIFSTSSCCARSVNGTTEETGETSTLSSKN